MNNKEYSTCQICHEGIARYFLNGKIHNEHGPAIIEPSGNKWWVINGKTHRTDGPAVEWIDGTCWWYLNDKKYSLEKYCKTLHGKDWEIYFTKYSLMYG